MNTIEATKIEVSFPARGSNGVLGTVEAIIEWHGPWIVDGDYREMAAQRKQIADSMNCTQIGPMEIVLL